MRYDFDKPIVRRGSGSYKWDSAADRDMLPMWVADMDFRTAPAVIDALRRRVEHGVFGYTLVPDGYYKAVIDWFGRRHGLELEREWFIYTSGVVPAVSAIIKALASPGAGVLLLTPVYNCFFSSIRNNGCHAVESALLYDDGTYTIDFDDFERKAAGTDVKLFLVCTPHNPGGRVWSAGELRRLGDICRRHGVIVVADEIHCELVFPGYRYVPFASLGPEYRDNSVTCVSPSKAFNIAGLQIANIIVSDAARRALIDKAINVNEVCDVNPFGVEALMAAYNEGGEWLDRLVEYLYGNYRYLKDYMESRFPELTVTRLEGTYLAWIDCRALKVASSCIEESLKSEVHLWINGGTHYGEAGEGFVRINFACPRSVLASGLDRFARWLTCHMDFGRQ